MDINCVDGLGNTPLHHAVLHADAEIMHYLRQEGADVKLTNNAGETVFHMCANNTKYSVEDISKS